MCSVYIYSKKVYWFSVDFRKKKVIQNMWKHFFEFLRRLQEKIKIQIIDRYR